MSAKGRALQAAAGGGKEPGTPLRCEPHKQRRNGAGGTMPVPMGPPSHPQKTSSWWDTCIHLPSLLLQTSRSRSPLLLSTVTLGTSRSPAPPGFAGLPQPFADIPAQKAGWWHSGSAVTVTGTATRSPPSTGDGARSLLHQTMAGAPQHEQIKKQ